MKVDLICIKDIVKYKNNAKIHTKKQIEGIAKSIEQFGFQQPIVIDKHKTVIVGHGRLEAALLLGHDKIPCIIAENLTDEEVKAYRIADNKLNESAWDVDLLTIELQDLSMTEIDLSGIIEDIKLFEPDMTLDDEIPLVDNSGMEDTRTKRTDKGANFMIVSFGEMTSVVPKTLVITLAEKIKNNFEPDFIVHFCEWLNENLD